jgi:hypothetical protein
VRVAIEGTATQRGTRDVFNGGEVRKPCLLTVTFDDFGAAIDLYDCETTGCEGFTEA